MPPLHATSRLILAAARCLPLTQMSHDRPPFLHRRCLEANKLAIQTLGGAGYVRDYPVEQVLWLWSGLNPICPQRVLLPTSRSTVLTAGLQRVAIGQLYRDNRLNMIHEGTAGIHALTLLGRKVQGGRAKPLFDAMHAAADEANAYAEAAGGSGARELAGAPSVESCVRECAGSLRRAVARAEEVTSALTSDTVEKRSALINAHEYLTLMGHTCVAWMWLRSAVAAARGLDALDARAAGEATGAAAADGAESEEHSFYRGKLHTCLFFHRHELPKTEALAALLLSGDATVEKMRPSWF